MPEMPEMQHYRNELERLTVGSEIGEVEVVREKSLNLPAEAFRRSLQGNRLLGIARRGKHLIFALSSGDSLLLHLMLGGWIYCANPQEAPERTAQVRLDLGEQTLFFLGLRLGYLHLLRPEELTAKLAPLGPEPTSPDFAPEDWKRRLRLKRGKLKPVLVDQHVIAGIGNCYCDEICFEAGILPGRGVESLQDGEFDRLYRAMREVLREAVSRGGYMENPIYPGDRLTGGYNAALRVYDRGGEPCPRCGNAIVHGELASRKVFYCAACQH